MSLKCEICQEEYEKDTVMISCEKCDSKVPISCDLECYINCYQCGKNVCDKHNIFHITRYSQTKRFEMCEECFMNIDDYDKYVNAVTVKRYYDKILEEQALLIDILRKENERLKTMIDYQPGGKGFVEAKRHFEALAEKN